MSVTAPDLTCSLPTPSWEGTWTVADLEALCRRYHGRKGAFAYRVFAWANHTVFDPLPLPLMQWALTPWGGCLGLTMSRAEDVPVITLHPAVWMRSATVEPDGRGWAERIIPGPRQTLDLILHELVHMDVTYRQGLAQALLP
jgi:hypothetical protein